MSCTRHMIDWTIERGTEEGEVYVAHEITVNFNFWPGYPAKTWGLPENCYPGEPAEVEIDGARDEVGALFELTDAEVADIKSYMEQNPETTYTGRDPDEHRKSYYDH